MRYGRHKTASIFLLAAISFASLAFIPAAYASAPSDKACAPPQWPQGSQERGEEGAVLLAFFIRADGVVGDSEVIKSTGYPGLDKAAREGLARCQFRPHAAPVWTRMQYVWSYRPAARPSPAAWNSALDGAARGDAQAEFDLANLHGAIVPVNFEERERLLKLAASKGNPGAVHNEAREMLHSTDPDVLKRAYTMTVTAAQQGYAPAQYQAAVMLKSGIGTAPDNDAAIVWLRRAQAQRHEDSAMLLGAMLNARAASPAESEEGVALLRVGAARHDIGAVYALGRSLENGQGVAQDYYKAAALYAKAAVAGHNAAQGALARLYESGQGVRIDLDKARALRAESMKPGPALD